MQTAITRLGNETRRSKSTNTEQSVVVSHRVHFEELVALAAFLGRIVMPEDQELGFFLQNTSFCVEGLLKTSSPSRRSRYLSQH